MASPFTSGRMLLMEPSRYDMELQAAAQINISVDLVSAAKRHLSLLQVVSGLPYLHDGPMVIQAIRRYLDYWMPLAARCEIVGVGNQKDFLPPLDVHWVWHCHCLDVKAYQQFCKSHYVKTIDVPFFNDVSSEVSARERCKLVWCKIYPDEPFDLEIVPNYNPVNYLNQASKRKHHSQAEENDLMASVSRQISFYKQVSQPYMYHDDFLHMAKERYKCFLYILHKSEPETICIPTPDIHIMWQSHKSFPVAYAEDTKEICRFVEDYDLLIHRQPDNIFSQAFENTSRIWETLFGYPYERAGAVCQVERAETNPLEIFFESIPVTINWHHQHVDVNSEHSSLNPRHVVEVCIQTRSTETTEKSQVGDLFVRLRTMEACKLLRLDAPLQDYKHDIAWHRIWLMQCEISSKGLVLELRESMSGCFGGFSKLLGQARLTWKELEGEAHLAVYKAFALKNRARSLDNWTIAASITPPVQAPYLLKSLPDRVTDDAGTMISKKIVRLNKYQPQKGRWMSRTVLNHAGKECFIIRIRVATGVWRRKTERPVGVDWNERIIHVHGGGWNYVTGSIGTAPDKIIASATPIADELEQYKMKWSFSNGETLTIQTPIEDQEWERHLRFTLKGSRHGLVRLLNGRQMQYQVPSAVPEEEEGFVTLVRYTAESRQGKATALFNWKISAMEVLPEEDVVQVMLICTATQRTVADVGGKTFPNFHNRRKRRGSNPGQRDWGSVVVGAGQGAPSEMMFWYLNPEEVLKMNLSEEDYEGVMPKGASDQMYRGTSWLYTGEKGGLYRLASRGSYGSFGGDIMSRFGSHTKVPAPC